MRYESLRKRPRHFQSFTGFKVDEFDDLVNTIKENWQSVRAEKYKRKDERQRKVGGGRKLALPDIQNRLIVFLVYTKLYPSYLLCEYLFQVDESNICRIVQELSLVLSGKIVIDRNRKKITTLEELREIIPNLDEVLLDATEQKIPRPSKKQARKAYYSGKKRTHTLKTQLMTDKKGLILYASDSSPGRIHDLKHYRATAMPKWLNQNPDIKAYADKGYVGETRLITPNKRTRWSPCLARSEKIRNTKLAKKRIAIEHAIAGVKKYNILASVYRNNRENYSAIFKSIVFLANARMLARQTC